MNNYENHLKIFEKGSFKSVIHDTYLEELTYDIATSLEVPASLKLEDLFKQYINPNIKAAMTIVNKYPRSKLLTRKATITPEYAGLTPIVLYAMKKHKGINYEDWDLDAAPTNIIKFILGNMLYNIYLFRSAHPPSILDDVDKIALREKYIDNILAYRKKAIPIGDTAIKAGDATGHLILQTWIANVIYRKPSMILDPWDWDAMPEPLDEKHKPEVEDDYDASGVFGGLPWEEEPEKEVPWQ